MTVLDTSGIVDYLVGDGAFEQVQELLQWEGTVAVPDVAVFEVVAVLRRHTLRSSLNAERAGAAIQDLGDFSFEVFPTLPLRMRAWELRENLTAADAFFVALAERLDEPLATKDKGLAIAAERLTAVEVIDLTDRNTFN